MTYVICEPCIDVKDTACVDVCPVIVFTQLLITKNSSGRGPTFIDPEECIDCGVCEPECPVEAIMLRMTSQKNGKVLPRRMLISLQLKV